MAFRNIRRILIIKLRHIGDVLLTVPAIRAVRETYPDAYIAALVNSGTEEMLTGNPLLNEILVFDREIIKLPFIHRIKKEWQFLRMVREKEFDMIIDLTSGDRAAICSFFSRAEYRLAFDVKNGFFGKRYLYTHKIEKSPIDTHTIERNLELVQAFGMDTDNKKLEFFWSAEDEGSIKRIFDENGIKSNRLVVHIHPTSRWLFKCWHDKAMAEIIDYLQERYLAKVIVTCGKDEKEMDKARDIIVLTRNKPVDLIGKTTLKQLGIISRYSHLFIGIDSAPMHIAAAVGTPVIALFGKGARHWHPRGERHIVISREIQSQGMQLDKVRSLAMTRITIGEVKEAIDRQIAKMRIFSGD